MELFLTTVLVVITWRKSPIVANENLVLSMSFFLKPWFFKFSGPRIKMKNKLNRIELRELRREKILWFFNSFLSWKKWTLLVLWSFYQSYMFYMQWIISGKLIMLRKKNIWLNYRQIISSISERANFCHQTSRLIKK